MADSPEAEDWADIDPLILDQKTIAAIQAYMASRGVHLRYAIEAVGLRAQHLRAIRPADFALRSDGEAYS